MNAEQRTIMSLLAQQLGVEPDQIERTLTGDPIAAVMALLDKAPQETRDPATRVRFVATLVGACPICLGEDVVCRQCGGKGGPGWREPDTAVVAWIAPALRRLGLCVGRPRRASSEQMQQRE